MVSDTSPSAAYFARAELCQREAERARSPSERESWLQLREGWLKLANGRNEVGQDKAPRLMDGLPFKPNKPG